jgi:hypothetical protein
MAPASRCRQRFTAAVAGLPGLGDRSAWALTCLRALILGKDTIGETDTSLAWSHFLEEVAATRPTVLLIEDLHRADDAILDLVDYLAERAARYHC